MEYIEHMNTRKIQRPLGLLIVCLMLFLISPPLLSQSLSSTDLTTIKVDDLSDEQLINYMQQAEASGYTQEQLEAFARQRGLPEVEIAKLRRRVSQLKLAMGQNSNGVNATGMRAPLDMTEEEVFGRLANSDLNNPLDSEEPMIFGFDLFKSDNLNFSPNLNIPTPTDYVLGPGDGIIVDLWGATQQYWNFEVSSEGTVRPPDLSPVYVNGLTMKEAQVKIINRLSQIYGGLKPIDNSDPTIFYQVSLGNIRTINVTIVGEVQSPGNYALNSLSTVFTGLHAAGGPTDRGTFRSIRLMRDNKLKTEIDLYDFLVDGIKPNDELLRAGDVIVVKLYEGQVELAGEVRRPGLYEIKEGDSFKDLLQNAGNFSSNAFKAFITVERNADNGKVVLNLAADELDKNYPADGDIVSVRPNLETFSNRVQLEGAVQIDGAYELTDNLTVKALIEKASGPRGDAYMERATIYRMNADLSQQTIPFNLQGVLSGADADIPLMREDIVRVSSIYELTEEYYVEISGEVALTGTYPFIHGMTVEDVILLAGGLTAGASGAKVEISRRNTGGVTNSLSEIITLNIDKNLSVRGAAQEIALNPFDQIFIRRTPNYNLQQQITVEGEITSPGAYAISRKDERVSDIMKRAGGLTPYAYPEGAILIRRTEFTQKKSPKELNFAKLKELRDKILADTSLAVNQARNELILRLESRIESLGEEFDQEESIGSTFKKRLTENISVVDSMASPVELSDREPTVLDLNKILENPGSKYDYIIREGDVISIPGKLETVRIAGEVISPLNLRYDDSFSFKDYVNDAGGFTSNAKKGRTYVQMADGRRKQTRRFLFFKFYPKVEPGSTIFVSRKPDRAPVNLQSAIAAVGSIATLALVIDRLSN